MPTINRHQDKLPWDASKHQPFGSRDNPNQKFYNSKAWRSASRAYLQEFPLCECCRVLGLTVEARLTDHVIPINQGGAKFDSFNFLALCHTCHNRKSGLESHTPILVAWLERHGAKLPTDIHQIIRLLNENR